MQVRLVEPTQAEVDAGNKVEEADRADGTPQAASEAGAAPLSRGVDAVAQLSLTNNLVWSRVVAPGATLDVPFEYVVNELCAAATRGALWETRGRLAPTLTSCRLLTPDALLVRLSTSTPTSTGTRLNTRQGPPSSSTT